MTTILISCLRGVLTFAIGYAAHAVLYSGKLEDARMMDEGNSDALHEQQKKNVILRKKLAAAYAENAELNARIARLHAGKTKVTGACQHCEHWNQVRSDIFYGECPYVMGPPRAGNELCVCGNFTLRG